jgi:hypothetical protein
MKMAVLVEAQILGAVIFSKFLMKDIVVWAESAELFWKTMKLQVPLM